MSYLRTDRLLRNFLNKIAKHAKFDRAEQIVDDAFYILKSEHGVPNPLQFFKDTVQNAYPVVGTKRVSVSGRTLNLPVPINERQARAAGLTFLRESFRERSEKWSGRRLAMELIELHQRQGASMNRRDDLHKVAEANRSFIHYLNRRR